jgi:hypothetical protein
MALEYQGETHFYSTHTYGSAANRQRVDQLKLKFAKEAGITLISIPFWWDKSRASLAATIQHYRPDMNFSVPNTPDAMISTLMPAKLLKAQYVPTYPRAYDTSVDPTGW